MGNSNKKSWRPIIAIAAIWLGVGLVGLGDKGGWTAVVAVCAMFATFYVADMEI